MKILLIRRSSMSSVSSSQIPSQFNPLQYTVLYISTYISMCKHVHTYTHLSRVQHTCVSCHFTMCFAVHCFHMCIVVYNILTLCMYMYMVRLYFTVMHLLTCCNFVYRLSELVSPPTAVTEMDWINRHWPDNLPDDYLHTKPQVSQIQLCYDPIHTYFLRVGIQVSLVV